MYVDALSKKTEQQLAQITGNLNLGNMFDWHKNHRGVGCGAPGVMGHGLGRVTQQPVRLKTTADIN